MSIYIDIMSKNASYAFKAKKRKFKKGKSCATCGKRYSREDMTVDHIVPMYQYSGSPFDTSNWQVLCLDCHREKSKKEMGEYNG